MPLLRLRGLSKRWASNAMPSMTGLMGRSFWQPNTPSTLVLVRLDRARKVLVLASTSNGVHGLPIRMRRLLLDSNASGERGRTGQPCRFRSRAIVNDASVTDLSHKCYKCQLAPTQTSFHGNGNEPY